MATFNNLRPAVECNFLDVPEMAFHIFTADWPEKFAHAVCVTFEQNLLIFGGVDGGVYSNELRLLNTRSQRKCARATDT